MIDLNEIQNNVLKAYPNYKQFLVGQDPKQLLVNFSEFHDIREAISNRRLTIKEMDDLYATENFSPGVDYFAKWLSFFNKFTNINKAMPPDTIEWVAIQLYSKYCHFYFADLKVIFEHLLESKFGIFYGSVDTVRIMSAFLEYDDIRNRIINQAAEQRKIEYEIWYKKRIVEVRNEVFQEMKATDKYNDWTRDQRTEQMKRVAEIRINEEAKKIFP